jgi:ABC-type transporter Mla MlaB component
MSRSTPAATPAPGAPMPLVDCTMSTIQSLHEELIQRLQAVGSVSLDGRDIQRPNTAMLQLLASFARELQEQSRSIEWVGQSEPLSRAASALGLASTLGLPAC